MNQSIIQVLIVISLAIMLVILGLAIFFVYTGFVKPLYYLLFKKKDLIIIQALAKHYTDKEQLIQRLVKLNYKDRILVRLALDQMRKGEKNGKQISGQDRGKINGSNRGEERRDDGNPKDDTESQGHWSL